MGPIEVKCRCGEKNCKEWAIIELQGVIEAQSEEVQNNLQNLEIGRICRPSSQESYTFTIGYHELTGSKVTLKKPLLVLKKVKHSDGDQSRSSESSTNMELDVIGIVRQKILFKTRPRALISSSKKA
ncbi:hypothetical protein BVRB_3g066790 [Beta vulgaris subsp. vulgaris]|uniref:uncharacterized protein LOC104906468 n=1 Tax=Beta vulgaris subsp. vulgaris TaxID=3555 RepID=UPI00053F8148|nr:uncharacterized protein LOC104906468 [Beta vulgaris subsp. vulgaris]XP_019107913.1 uncharacterized protein LOC104906468 [Beta vulgaris subsp. vulgaris]KMS99080.1 hypothetical protein BVRB_3g066790 [Beta vulgaris subsp. vulgaris]